MSDELRNTPLWLQEVQERANAAPTKPRLEIAGHRPNDDTLYLKEVVDEWAGHYRADVPRLLDLADRMAQALKAVGDVYVGMKRENVQVPFCLAATIIEARRKVDAAMAAYRGEADIDV